VAYHPDSIKIIKSLLQELNLTVRKFQVEIPIALVPNLSSYLEEVFANDPIGFKIITLHSNSVNTQVEVIVWLPEFEELQTKVTNTLEIITSWVNA